MTENKEILWDTLICSGLVFDGFGGKPQLIDVAIKDGKIVAKGLSLPRENAAAVIDATDRWVMPGLLDIHTHLDLEVEIAPGLGEVVRHGTTTVVVGNCSLGTAFGAQKTASQNPIIDCFARVENIPKHVLERCAGVMNWDNSADYLKHLEQLPLGPNMAPLIPHSMLRIKVMGLEASIKRDATEEELVQMASILQEAVDQGYIGFSTDNLPFHYLAEHPNTDQRIPTQFAKLSELKRLTAILRSNDRVWQATPMPSSTVGTLARFILTSGRLYGKALRVSALTALDFSNAPKAGETFLKIAKLLNSNLLKGDFHLQALSMPFKMWGDGVTMPILEEYESTCQLIAKELDDREGRLELLNDPQFITRFKKDWHKGKSGWNLPHLMSRLGLLLETFSRELVDITVDRCPLPSWNGETLDQPFRRLQQYQRNETGASSDEEATFFETFSAVADDADFILEILRKWDKDFRWFTIIANKDPQRVKELLFHEHTLPGFNDSGAHLTNLAFYDGNLVTLKIAAQESLDKVSEAVKRLTHEPAQFFGIDVGNLNIGAQADLIVIDPQALKNYDSDSKREIKYRDDFQNEQLVNRSDGVVCNTIIAGHRAWQDTDFTPLLGTIKMGRPLTYAGRMT
ncbi:MAG: N-acyl-D-aspartate/D-glutamate deacylase [Gammaproteobacteria bacterium]|jgi:N-acyl-D-aspartate/D-glutamate deacylase